MNEVKQVIVVRKDLKIAKGLLAAQVAHASLAVILDMMKYRKHFAYEGYTGDFVQYQLRLLEEDPVHKWLQGPFTKTVLAAPSWQELIELRNKAEKAGLPHKLITEHGSFDMSTDTCLAIGPRYSEEIDKITGHLKLL